MLMGCPVGKMQLKTRIRGSFPLVILIEGDGVVGVTAGGHAHMMTATRPGRKLGLC
jgi:hypothetical protein